MAENEKSNIVQETNTAMAGLDMDRSLNQIATGKLTYALNALTEHFDGNSVSYQNEPGNELCLTFPEGFVLIGKHFISERSKHIFFLTNPNTGDCQIGWMENNDCEYRVLVNSPCLNFNISHPIHSVVHKITNCTTEIYWTDGFNSRRYLDIDNIPKILKSGSPLCSPIYTDDVDCNQLRIQPDFDIPQIDVTDVVNGGNNKAGVYQFAVCYADAMGNPYTSYYSVTNPTPLADIQVATVNFDYNVGKSIVLSVSNLDITGHFKYFNLAVVKTINDISSVELVGTYSIEQSTRQISYTGQGVSDIRLSIKDIFEKYPYYDVADDLTTAQDVLIWKGLSTMDRINYQQIASQIELQWETWRIPATENYADEINATNFRGYPRDEILAFEFVPLFTNGRQGDGFHIPGRKKGFRETVNPDIPDTNDDFIGVPSYYVGTTGYSPYWKIYNTASVIGTSGEYTTDVSYKGPYQYGEFAYWESTDEYPCNVELWGELAGQKIRHHKFPDVAISPIFETKIFTNQYSMVMGSDAIFPIGVKVNVAQVRQLINSSNLTDEQKADIVGFKIVRGDRGTNKSIVAKGILRNVNSYDREGQTYYFANYPYNDVREDPFLNSTNNAFSDICDSYNITVQQLVPDLATGVDYAEIEFTNCNTNKQEKKKYYTHTFDRVCSIGKPIALSGRVDIGYSNYDLYTVSSTGAHQGWRVEYDDIETGITRRWVHGWLGTPRTFDLKVVVGTTPTCVEGCENGGRSITFRGTHSDVATCATPTPISEISDDMAYRQIFNSPETSFGQPFLGNVLKVESVIFGAGKAHFVEVKDNAKYKLLTKEAQEDALKSSENLALMTGTLEATAMFAAYQAYLTIYVNGITRRNYAHSFNSIASYDYSIPVPDGQGVKQRNIDIAKYLIPGVISVGEGNSINNYQRESSVYIKTDENKSPLPLPDQSPDMLIGTVSKVKEYSRFTISEIGKCSKPAEEEDIRVVSYYASLKNVIDNQWGQIYSYDTVDTGYQVIFDSQIANSTIFGGDTFISRFAFKTKLPFFTDNRVGAPDDSDIFYDEIGNVGYPKYWHSSRSVLSSYSTTDVGVLSNIVSYKAHNFDCPNDQALAIDFDPSDPSTDPAVNTSRTYCDGSFYLFAYGVPNFYCESSYNTDLRQAFNNREGDFWPHVSTHIPDDWVQEKFVSIANDNTYYYNVTFSKINRENDFTHLPPDWDSDKCFTEYPFRGIYSDPQSTDVDNRMNSWRIYRATSYFDFPQNYGDFVAIDGIENKAVLARFENKTLLYNNLLTIDTSNPQAAYLGNPTLFRGAPPIDFADTDLGYAGTQNKMLLKIPQGKITVDAKRGQVFLLNGTEATDLSAFGSGLHKFFTDHLAFEILKYFPNVNIDNHFNGIGLHGVYDSKYDRIILTKRDYVPIDDRVKYDATTGEFYIEEVISMNVYNCELFGTAVEMDPCILEGEAQEIITTTTTTTTIFCDVEKYGLLYNWYACAGTGANSLSSSDDWGVVNLQSIGITGADKETGTTYWNSPNTGATNANGLRFRGCGYRSGISGAFSSIKDTYVARFDPTQDYHVLSSTSSSLLSANGDDRYKLGFSQRLANFGTTLAVGYYGTYTGNDGKVYGTKCIAYMGGEAKVEIMTCDLAETEYRDHTPIPEVTVDDDWKVLVTGAMCAYNNDWNNV